MVSTRDKRERKCSYQRQDSRKMVPTGDNREEGWFLLETTEKRDGSYQRQQRREMVPTRDNREERWFLLETTEKRDGSY